MSFGPAQGASGGGSLGATVEVSEVESLADGTIIIGDGAGAPTTLAAFSSATGTLKVANGGTGAATLTGLVKGNGTSAMTAAVAGTDYVAPGGALGTPSSGVLTNCTGLPLAGGGTGGTTAATARTALGLDDLHGRPVNTRKRTYRPDTNSSGTFLLTEDTAYFVYMGYTTEAVTPKHVEFHVQTGGTGAQTAEVGLFSSPLAPNKGNQSLTKLVATGTVDDLTTTGVKRNTSAFATSVAAGTHLWAGIRTAMATNEPTIGPGISYEYGQGNILTTATAGALTNAGPWTGAVVAGSTATTAPVLTIVLD